LLINTARADIVDLDAMIEAINTKNIRVALDVIKNEPEGKTADISSPLQALKNVYVTHHIGASTEQAQNAVAAETIRIIKDYIQSGIIAHWVNKAKIADAHYQLVVKHFDKPGVLASIMSIIREKNINIEEIENIIFDGGVVACCTMKLKTPLTTEMLKQMNENANVLSVSHVAI
jgi:D-3-phosphoglycerate dehydrogenase / 2-oxoglutarate reductase